MTNLTVSISQLKTTPAKIVSIASDYPVAVEKRNKVKAYLIGKDLYELIVEYIEDYLDKTTVNLTNFKKGRSFEKIAKELVYENCNLPKSRKKL